MLKRLLTAVFVLGLILALNGTAFSGPGNPEIKDWGPRPATYTDVTAKVRLPIGYTAPASKINPLSRTEVSLSQHPAIPGMTGADTTECGYEGYVASGVYIWTIKNTTSTSAFAMHMDGASAPGFKRQISGAYVWIYRAHDDPAVLDGQITGRITVYNDAAGLPGSVLYTEDYILAPHSNLLAYTYFPFATPVLASGSYHIAISVAPTSDPDDDLVIISDDAGETGSSATVTGRTSWLYTGTWYTGAAYWAPDTFDPNFDIVSEYCQVYSSCYKIFPIPAPGYVSLWEFPDPVWPDGSTLNGFAQRFVATGPETLKTVEVRHYDYGGYNGTSTNQFTVSIYPDDGTGNVDYSGAPLASVTPPAGVGLFPGGGFLGNGRGMNVPVDFSAFNLVLLGAYHITVQSTSNNPANGSFVMGVSYEGTNPAAYSDGSGGSVFFTAPGSGWKRTGQDPTWLASGGKTEQAFNVRPSLCKDEFSSCQVAVPYDDNTNLLGVGPVGVSGRSAVAQLIQGDPVNRIEKIRVMVDPDAVKPLGSIAVMVWADAGGTPGATLDSIYVDNADLVLWPGWTEVVIPGGLQTLGSFFVGVHQAYESSGDFTWVDWDYGYGGHTTHVGYNGGTWEFANSTLAWRNRFAAGIDAYQNNLLLEVEYCSIPPQEWACTGADNFATSSYDYYRDGHTGVALSDAYCDLNYKWMYQEPNATLGDVGNGGGACWNSAPIIYENYVVCAFNSKFLIFDLTTGALLHTISGTGAPYFVQLNSVRGNPTIATVDVAGTPTPILFYGGGTTYGQVTAVKLVPPFDPLWSVNSFTSVGLGYPGAIGNTAMSAFVKASIAGTDYLFFSTGNGSVYAANPATGAKIWGPLTLSSYNTFRNLAFDGATLYLAGTEGGSSVNGDVYAVNAAAGTIKWQLSSAPGGGLKGGTIQAGSVGEIFPDQIVFGTSTAGNEVWASSAWLEPTAPSEGLLYKIKAADGGLFSTPQATQHFYQGNGSVIGANMILDAKRIIVPGGNAWTSVPMGGTMLSYNRFTGGADWKTTGGGPIGSNGTYLGNGFMTCEPGAPDYIFAGDSKGYLSCFDGDTGKEIFHRRLNNTPLGWSSAWAGGAVSKTGVVVFASRIGQLVALEKGANRPRLEIVKTSGKYNVPYGSPASVPVTFSKMFTNTGCGPLTGTATFSASSNGATAGAAAFDGDIVSGRSESIADQLAHNSTQLIKNAQLVSVSENMTEPTDSKMLVNRAAMSNPIFLNPPFTQSFTLNPGDSGNLNFDVNGPMVNRGPNQVYVQFQSNDPDYFLNDPTAQPQILITFMGGCLMDTTRMTFGAASANWRLVTNSGRLGTGDMQPSATPPGPGNWNMGGTKSDFYQGTYVMGVSTERIAMNTQDWTGGGGEDNSWNSMQADPNLCNGDCKPALTNDVPLGKISTDGVTYNDLFGRLVCLSYIDSVQNFGPPNYASWNWGSYATLRFNAPFDPTMTMGLQVHSRVFAAKDVPAPFEALNFVTVDHMKINQRYGQALAGWKFGAMIDYDIGGDTAGIDKSISAAWSFTPDVASSNAFGIIKLPFGGSYAPMKNVKALDADQAQFNRASCRGNCYWDSAYTYMSQDAPISQVVSSAPQDQEFHATIAEHDFAAGSDVYEFAVAHFWMKNVTNPGNGANYAGLANLVNQWVGFGRGDVNNDGIINLADILYLAAFVNGPAGTPGPIPFAHLGDVDANGLTNAADVQYLVNYYFSYGAAPLGQFIQY